MKKGFSLVEISVVLVLISILVGGILLGNTMSSASKIASQIKQIQEFDISVSSHQAEYKFLPGDSPKFGGNGDGAIDYVAPGQTHAADAYSCEISNFWNVLDPDSYLAGGQCGIDMNTGGATVKAVPQGASKNVPAAKLGKPKSFLIAIGATGVTNWEADLSPARNYYMILDPTQIQTANLCGTRYAFTATSATNSAVKPTEMASLDKKMDDGIPATGSVIAGGFNNACGASGAAATTWNNTTCYTGTTYSTSENYLCTPMILIGSQNGASQ